MATRNEEQRSCGRVPMVDPRALALHRSTMSPRTRSRNSNLAQLAQRNAFARNRDARRRMTWRPWTRSGARVSAFRRPSLAHSRRVEARRPCAHGRDTRARDASLCAIVTSIRPRPRVTWNMESEVRARHRRRVRHRYEATIATRATFAAQQSRHLRNSRNAKCCMTWRLETTRTRATSKLDAFAHNRNAHTDASSRAMKQGAIVSHAHLERDTDAK